jgi:chemosensory pili system protein ChpA (sensor histidine kinase/response regulator)
VELLAKGNDLDDSWLGKFCYPIFDELYERLGEPTPEDITTLLSSEDDPEIISLLFETEVEEYLKHLEARLKNSNKSGLRAELVMMATELGGLGEMLQLTAFTQLCQSVSHYLETDPDSAVEIADLALKAWRQSQTLVLSNLRGNLPTKIDFGEVINHNLSEPLNKQDYLLNKSAISDFQLLENVELSPESADFVSADSGLASENLPIDYKYTERKTDIHLFPKERDQKIADSLNELFKHRDNLYSYNKKALYILIRERTGVSTQYITKIVGKYKVIYTELYSDYSKGTIKNLNHRIEEFNA